MGLSRGGPRRGWTRSSASPPDPPSTAFAPYGSAEGAGARESPALKGLRRLRLRRQGNGNPPGVGHGG